MIADEIPMQMRDLMLDSVKYHAAPKRLEEP